MFHCYCLEDFHIIKYSSMIINDEYLISAKNWILSMTDIEDNENGIDFWKWIEDNNEILKNDSTNLLNTFFMFFHNNPNIVVGTGSIIIDDQNMGKNLCLKDALWIGGINVHRNFRRKSIGKILFEYINNYIKQTIKKDLTIYLFTNNSYAKNIYKQYNFKSKGFIENNSIKEYNQTGIHNELFVKVYQLL